MGPGAPVRERALIRSAGGACAMTRCSAGCSAARPSGLWQAGSSRFGCGLRNRRSQVRILTGALLDSERRAHLQELRSRGARCEFVCAEARERFWAIFRRLFGDPGKPSLCAPGHVAETTCAMEPAAAPSGNAADSKAVDGLSVVRGFDSLPLRYKGDLSAICWHFVSRVAARRRWRSRQRAPAHASSGGGSFPRHSARTA